MRNTSQGYGIVFDQHQVAACGGFWGTVGMGPCVGAAIIRMDNSLGFVAHMDGRNNAGGLYSPLAIIQEMMQYYNFPLDACQAFVISGTGDNAGLAARIRAAFATVGFQRISSRTSETGDFVFNYATPAYNENFTNYRSQEQLFLDCRALGCFTFRLRTLLQSALVYEAPVG